MKDDNTWLWIQYGGDDEPAAPDASRSWQDAFADLGRQGWELVQVHRHEEWTDFWLKRQHPPTGARLEV